MGLKYAIQEAILPHSIDLKRETVTTGMVARLHIGLHDPKFGNPTRDHLTNREAFDAVFSFVRQKFGQCLKEDPSILKTLAEAWNFPDLNRTNQNFNYDPHWAESMYDQEI